MESLGEFLKSGREARNISLEEISKKTRISLKILTALEKDDKKAVPSDTFARGFLKAYAKCVGLDETDVLLRYEHFYNQEEKEEYKPEVIEDFFEKKTSSSTFWILCAIAVILLGYFFFKSDGSAEKDSKKPAATVTKKAKSSDDIFIIEKEKVSKKRLDKKALEDKLKAEKAEEKEKTLKKPKLPPLKKDAPKEPSSEKPQDLETEELVKPALTQEKIEKLIKESTLQEGDRHKLVFRSDGIVWMLIQIDDNEPYEVTLRAEEVYQIKADEKFKLKIGNAGKVKVELNNEDLGYMGEEKQVLSITLPRPAE